MRTVQEKAESFRGSLAKIAPICHAQRRALTHITGALQDASCELAAALRETARGLRERAAAVDFRADFGRFVEASKLIRYDIVCDNFPPVDVSHPVFADIDTRLGIVVPPMYPVGIGRVVDDFVAKGADQLSVVTGKYVLLMETITDGWVFASNPLTRVMGYIPGHCVEAVGRAIAVVLKVPRLLVDNVHIQLGDYVAVMGSGETPAYEILTTRGEQLSVPKDTLGIIYE
jgi:hypothetical protein